MKYLIIIASIFLVSCSPQKRLDRLVKKHPHLVKVEIDTIEIPTRIEVIVPEVKLDTQDSLQGVINNLIELLDNKSDLNPSEKTHAIRTAMNTDTITKEEKGTLIWAQIFQGVLKFGVLKRTDTVRVDTIIRYIDKNEFVQPQTKKTNWVLIMVLVLVLCGVAGYLFRKS